MDDPFTFVQTPVVSQLVPRSNKLTTKVTIKPWLSGLARLQQDSKIGVQGNMKPTRSSLPYSAMRVGFWVIASSY